MNAARLVFAVALLGGCSFSTDPAPVPWRDDRPDRPAPAHGPLPTSPKSLRLQAIVSESVHVASAPTLAKPIVDASIVEDSSAPADVRADAAVVVDAGADVDAGWGECDPGVVCWLNPKGREHCSFGDTPYCRVDEDCHRGELCAPEGHCAERCSP